MPLDYESSQTRQANFKGADGGALILAGCVGFAVTFPAVFLAIISAGAGHGDYLWARLLFPYSMVLAMLTGSIGPISIGVAFIQFPVYGAGLVWFARSRRLWVMAVAIGVLLHFLMFVIASRDSSFT
jgi:hypothetical protein